MPSATTPLDLKIPPVIVVAVAAIAMLILARCLPMLSVAFPYRMLILGALATATLTLAIPALTAFRRNRTTLSPTAPANASTLIHSGVYRLSRNPLYLALLLVLTGLAVWLSNLAACLVLPAFVVYMTRFQIIPEERILLQRFGDDYASYLRRVRRWI